MTIFGPLVAPRTSTVTPALSSEERSLVTFSPSTTITTGRVSDSPGAVATLSISMTSPTATFCCLLPLRTIAYTATHSPRWFFEMSGSARLAGGAHVTTDGGGSASTRRSGVQARRGSTLRGGQHPGQNGSRSALAGALALDRDVEDEAALGILVLPVLPVVLPLVLTVVVPVALRVDVAVVLVDLCLGQLRDLGADRR